MYEVWGVPRLGMLGNEEHLTAARPQDHTPYSVTAWPDALPGYIVCACDAENRVINGISLGDGLLREARAGAAPWMKYLNYDGRQYHCQDGFQAPKPNADRHVHVSGRTDQLKAGIGDLDPFQLRTGDDTVFLIQGTPGNVQHENPAKLFVTDGASFRRWITAHQYDRFMYAVNTGRIKLSHAEVLGTDDLDAFGPDITDGYPVKGGTGTLNLPIKLAGVITAELNQAGA